MKNIPNINTHVLIKTIRVVLRSDLFVLNIIKKDVTLYLHGGSGGRVVGPNGGDSVGAKGTGVVFPYSQTGWKQQMSF